MTIQFSTGLRNALLDQIETTIGTSAVMKIFTGSQPANCATGDSGTLLVVFSLASDWAAAASGGTKAFNNTPISGTAGTTGTAGYYRIYDSGTSTCHEQGAIGTSTATADATIDNTSIVTGQTVQITAFTKTAPGV